MAVELWASSYQMLVQMSSASAGLGEPAHAVPQLRKGLVEPVVELLSRGTSRHDTSWHGISRVVRRG